MLHPVKVVRLVARATRGCWYLQQWLPASLRLLGKRLLANAASGLVPKIKMRCLGAMIVTGKAGDERTLVLFVRVDCHLCQAMHGELLPWVNKLGFRLEISDIDNDTSLRERYDHKVPVLCEGETEICHHFLDEDMLLEHFGQRS